VIGIIKKERLKRLLVMARKAAASPEAAPEARQIGRQVEENFGLIEEALDGSYRTEATNRKKDLFLTEFTKTVGADRSDYLQAIKSLPPAVRAPGVNWLAAVVADCREKVAAAIPSF
jgi:hypothetical protein